MINNDAGIIAIRCFNYGPGTFSLLALEGSRFLYLEKTLKGFSARWFEFSNAIPYARFGSDCSVLGLVFYQFFALNGSVLFGVFRFSSTK